MVRLVRALDNDSAEACLVRAACDAVHPAVMAGIGRVGIGIEGLEAAARGDVVEAERTAIG